jgi:hypothetical protein
MRKLPDTDSSHGHCHQNLPHEQQHGTAFPPKTAENIGAYYAFCMITYLRVLQHLHTGVGLPQQCIAPTGGITSSCLQSPKDVWHAANICRGHCSPDGTGGAGDCREAALGAVPVGSLNMEGSDYASELILIPHLQHAWLQTHPPILLYSTLRCCCVAQTLKDVRCCLKNVVLLSASVAQYVR